MIRVVHTGTHFLPIPDPGLSGQKGPRSRIRIRNTVIHTTHPHGGQMCTGVPPFGNIFVLGWRATPAR
jgi:hypothetical protein